MNRYDPDLAADVAGASASHTWNLLKEIAALTPPEGYCRLSLLFETAILAYVEAAQGWGVPQPSRN